MANVMTAEQAKAERAGARRLYLLSLWLPLLLPLSACLGPLALLWPLIILGLVAVGFFSRHAFVRWHTGQWTLLTFPAALFALWSLSSIFNDYYGNTSGYMCFALISIGGWYLGNIIGFRQARRGRCWLWGWLAPTTQLPRPWAATPAVPAASMSADSYTALEQGRSLLKADRRAEAIASLMDAFRNGSPDLRQQAVAELEKLGEVEMF
jgi:hypothetical protein